MAATALVQPPTRTRSRRRPDLSVVRPINAREPKVQAASDEQARRFAVCRALGHRWSHVGFASPEERVPFGEYNSVGYVSTCDHCGARRVKWMGRYGTRGTTTYSYSEGYQRHADERLSLQEWRRTWLVSELGDKA